MVTIRVRRTNDYESLLCLDFKNNLKVQLSCYDFKNINIMKHLGSKIMTSFF